MHDKLCIFTLGRPRVLFNNKECSFHRRKTLAILTFLAMNRSSYTREALATFFWPHLDRRHGLAALRQCLMELPRNLSPDFFELQNDTVGLAATDAIWIDAEELHTAAADCRKLVVAPQGGSRAASKAAKLDQTAEDFFLRSKSVVELYKSDFLSGFTLSDSVEFDDWQTMETESLRQEYLFLLTWMVHRLEQQQRYYKAAEYCRVILRQDPLDEHSHRLLMRFLYLSGDQHAALKQYYRCTEILKSELGVSPDGETTQLFHLIQHRFPLGYNSKNQPQKKAIPHKLKIKSQTLRRYLPWFVTAALFLVLTGILVYPHLHISTELFPPKVAVIQFHGLGNEHTANWTARGFSELLMNKLARQDRLHLVAGATVNTYGNPPPTIEKIAQTLNADYLIEGAVLYTEGKLTIVGRLISAHQNMYIWQFQYNSGNEDILNFLDHTSDEVSIAVLNCITENGKPKQEETQR